MIYLDNAATTRPDPEVVRAMLPYYEEFWGNPSGVYQFAGKAKAAVTAAREKIAALIGARPDEIFFTSGGSEADNWALTAAFESQKEKGNHIITTKIEHPAILRTCEYLERERGAAVTYLDVDADGFVDPAAVEAAITDRTILISVMTANNEIGTIEPIRAIGDIARAHGILFHTDAVQAYGQIPIRVSGKAAESGEKQTQADPFAVDAENVDLLSASGHKLNGPKGIGFLYIRRGTKLTSFIHGGAQEHNRRAGTENVPGIVGLGKAAELAAARMQDKIRKETALRDSLISRIRNEIPNVRLNGPDPAAGSGALRLPNNVNFSFEFTEGESILIMLDMQGICASSGSACSSGSLDPSHVLKAAGLSDSLAHGALRLTLSGGTTQEELDTTVEALSKIVGRLRKMSPRYAAFRKGQLASET